jgi:hypothetical protein
MSVNIVSHDFTPRRVAAPRPAPRHITDEEIATARENNSSLRQVHRILDQRREKNPRPAFSDADILSFVVDSALMSCDTWDHALRMINTVASWSDNLLDTLPQL